MKYVIVYHIEGEYEDAVCKHDYIAIFPDDATKAEIYFTINSEKDDEFVFEEIELRKYVPIGIIKVFKDKKKERVRQSFEGE